MAAIKSHKSLYHLWPLNESNRKFYRNALAAAKTATHSNYFKRTLCRHYYFYSPTNILPVPVPGQALPTTNRKCYYVSSCTFCCFSSTNQKQLLTIATAHILMSIKNLPLLWQFNKSYATKSVPMCIHTYI